MSVINLARPATKPAKPPWLEDEERERLASHPIEPEDDTDDEDDLEIASRPNNLPALREEKPHPGLFSFKERARLAQIREQKKLIMRSAALLQEGFAKGQVAIRFESNADGVVWGRLEVLVNHNGHLRAVPVATLTQED